MGAKNIIFKSEEPKTRGEVATFLRELASRIETGTVIFKRGEEEVSLALPEKVILEIKAEIKTKPGKVKHALEVEIEWREGEGEEGVALA